MEICVVRKSEDSKLNFFDGENVFSRFIELIILI